MVAEYWDRVQNELFVDDFSLFRTLASLGSGNGQFDLMLSVATENLSLGVCLGDQFVKNGIHWPLNKI